MSDSTWTNAATRLLRSEMQRQGMTFKDLSRQLEPLGVNLRSAQLSNKVKRGTFSHVFFLQCMRALDVEVVRLFESEPGARAHKRSK